MGEKYRDIDCRRPANILAFNTPPYESTILSRGHFSVADAPIAASHDDFDIVRLLFTY